MTHPIKAGVDMAVLTTVLGAWTEYVPPIVAILGGVWYAIQIFEWLSKRKRYHDKE